MKHKSISEFNKWLKNGIDFLNTKISFDISGEISSIKVHHSGHVYATLKEQTDTLNIIIWKSTYYNTNKKLNVGDNVVIKGKINYYSPNSSISFIVTSYVIEQNEGDLKKYLEEIKTKYEKLGYFNKNKSLPQNIKTVGIITASSGEAINDIVQTINRRNPFIKTILFPCLVQGEKSKFDIAKKIRIANNYSKYKLDALIVGRGGGSFEDLFAFNEPEVIEEIYNSQIFIVSAVGHEGDHLLSDLVSDLRASTPTAAAELLTNVTLEDKKNILVNYNQYLELNFTSKFENYFTRLKNINIDRNIENRLSSYKERIKDFNLDNLVKSQINLQKKRLLYLEIEDISVKLEEYNKKIEIESIDKIVNSKLQLLNEYIINMDSTLSSLGPKSLLKRGFSIIKNENGEVINSKNKLEKQFSITFADGDVVAKKV